ncbi:MAG: hypothetical protein IT363_12915 [Methanoregulaceae archaeon]|nr:hypothetical protein [Methanoregulaceae archaeon]
MIFEELTRPESPGRLRDRFVMLRAQRDALKHVIERNEKRLAELQHEVELEAKVDQAMATLTDQLFSDVAELLQDRLTTALEEVLDQPLRFRAETKLARGVATVRFWIERDGNEEDILKGQGGSVTNVLSVCLRMFALRRCDEKLHRPFLVLDEPDAWLRPDVVPRLVKIIAEAGRELGFQTILISHHDIDLFSQYADRVYRLDPQGDGSVRARIVGGSVTEDEVEAGPPRMPTNLFDEF